MEIKISGHPLPPPQSRSSSISHSDTQFVSTDCARREYQLLANSVRGMSVRCDERGDYAPVQCLGSQCHCVERATGHWRRDVPSQHVADIEKLSCGAAGTAQPAY